MHIRLGFSGQFLSPDRFSTQSTTVNPTDDRYNTRYWRTISSAERASLRKSGFERSAASKRSDAPPLEQQLAHDQEPEERHEQDPRIQQIVRLVDEDRRRIVVVDRTDVLEPLDSFGARGDRFGQRERTRAR